MKTYTQFVREGELLGPVDWSYDFRSHFFGPTRACNSDDNNQRRMDRAMGVLRAIARNDSTEPTAEWIVTTNGFAHPLLAVGMYDGWPFWKPTPAVLYRGVLGPERAFFYELEKAVTP